MSVTDNFVTIRLKKFQVFNKRNIKVKNTKCYFIIKQLSVLFVYIKSLYNIFYANVTIWLL